MITGISPFEADYDSATLYGILNEEPTPISNYRSEVPLDLIKIIDKCLKKNLSARYQKVEDLILDLKKLSNSSKI